MTEHHEYQEIDDDDDDEFEPLFDYRRVYQPPVEDDSDDDVTLLDNKARTGPAKLCGGSMDSKVVLKDGPGSEANKQIEDTSEDEDWLPPPPKCARLSVADPTISQLRQKRAELVSLTTEAALKKIEETLMGDTVKSKPDPASHTESVERLVDRGEVMVSAPGSAVHLDFVENTVGKGEKVVVSIQDKDGVCKSFRIFMGDKFMKLFKAYARSVGSVAEGLIFSFDGHQIGGDNTPKDLRIEDEDIIEVDVRM